MEVLMPIYIYRVAATKSPIIFLGVGEHLQDMDRFEPKSFIRKVLGVQDMRDVIEHVQDTININDNKKLMKNIEKGKSFLFVDLHMLNQI